MSSSSAVRELSNTCFHRQVSRRHQDDMTRGITKASIPLMSIAIGISLLLFHLFQGSQLDFPGHPVKSYPSILGPVRFPEASLLEEPTQLWSKSANDAESAAIVLASTTKDDVTWINSFQNSSKIFVYTADDPDAGLSVPVNRGHEAMVYLTYIIDHYFQLPSVVVFMHAHRFTWHNPVMFGFDSFELVQRLNLDRVRRIKYMNVRCEQDPGCPDWLHLDEEGDSLKHQEQRIIATCWKELFPFDEMPKRLAQPCCGQFAVARDRLQAIPLSRFVYYRDWLLRTELTDYFSGRMVGYMILLGMSSTNIK